MMVIYDSRYFLKFWQFYFAIFIKYIFYKASIVSPFLRNGSNMQVGKMHSSPSI